MTTSPRWEQWDGNDFPSEQYDSTIYYYPGTVDIEDPDNLHDLIAEIHLDGVADSRAEARELMDKAVVVHGQTIVRDGELYCYTGPKDDLYDDSQEATWVELIDSE